MEKLQQGEFGFSFLLELMECAASLAVIHWSARNFEAASAWAKVAFTLRDAISAMCDLPEAVTPPGN